VCVTWTSKGLNTINMHGATTMIMQLLISVTSNHHQADISAHGHDMFSAYSMGSHIVSTEHVLLLKCLPDDVLTCNRNM